MAVTVAKIRSRIGDPPSTGAKPRFSDDDIEDAIAVAQEILSTQKKVPVTGVLGENAVRLQASISLKRDIITAIGLSSINEGVKSVQIRDAETLVAGWQKELDDYVDAHRPYPGSVE